MIIPTASAKTHGAPTVFRAYLRKMLKPLAHLIFSGAERDNIACLVSFHENLPEG
jgi:hypothetical protein